jgi:L-aspartate oxidase
MSLGAGVLRDAAGLDGAAVGLARLAEQGGGKPGTETWETTNLLTVAAALVQAARRREETRGAHWRDDYPERDDARWHGHLDTTLDPDGSLMTRFAPPTVANAPGFPRDSDGCGCKP